MSHAPSMSSLSSQDSEMSAASLPLPLLPSESHSPDEEMYVLYEQIGKLRGAFQQEFAPSHPWYPIMEELVRTEDQYISDINSIVSFYVPKFKDLEEEMPDLITPQTSQEIFINLEQIRDFHQRFNQSLKPLLSNDSLEGVGKLFQEQADNFKIYSEYCSNHPKSVDLLVKLSKNKAIDSQLKSVQCELQHQLNLSTYLLKPVQRVLKYKLLLQSMLKHCEEGTEARAMLVSASDRMDFITKEINELKAISENKQMLEEIQYGLDSTPFSGSLNDYGTIQLQDTMLDLKAAKTRQERMVVLMDNALLICKVREKQVKQVRNTGRTLRGRKSPYKFKDLIKDDHVKKDDQAFLVHKQQGRNMVTYCFRAKSVVRKNHWVSTLQDLVLSSFHFAPDLLEQIMNTLQCPNMLSIDPSAKLGSLARNMKLLPISQSFDWEDDEPSLGEEPLRTRPVSMIDYVNVTHSVPPQKISNFSGDISCEIEDSISQGVDEDVNKKVRSYSKRIEMRSRPMLPIPKEGMPGNQERDSGISESYSSSSEVKKQMKELLSTMQQDYATFQDSTRERDSGVEEAPMPSQLDFMSIKRKHEGMVKSLVRNYMDSVTQNNNESVQLESNSPLPIKHSRTPEPLNIPASHPYADRKMSDPSLLSPSPSPTKKEKPPLSPKPPHLKVSGSPHHKAKYNSRTLPKGQTQRQSVTEGMRKRSDSGSNSPLASPSPLPHKQDAPSKVSGMASLWEKTIEKHREECQKI